MVALSGVPDIGYPNVLHPSVFGRLWSRGWWVAVAFSLLSHWCVHTAKLGQAVLDRRSRNFSSSQETAEHALTEAGQPQERQKPPQCSQHNCLISAVLDL